MYLHQLCSYMHASCAVLSGSSDMCTCRYTEWPEATVGAIPQQLTLLFFEDMVSHRDLGRYNLAY